MSFSERLLAPLAGALTRAGFSATGLALFGLIAGLAAAACVMMGHYLPGLALFLLSRATLSVTRAGQSASIDIVVPVLDGIALASLPFAFALSDPTRGIAATFELFGFVAFRSAGVREDGVFVLVTTIGLASACAVPGWFGVQAYVVGVLGFALCGIACARAIGDRSP